MQEVGESPRAVYPAAALLFIRASVWFRQRTVSLGGLGILHISVQAQYGSSETRGCLLRILGRFLSRFTQLGSFLCHGPSFPLLWVPPCEVVTGATVATWPPRASMLRANTLGRVKQRDKESMGMMTLRD